MTNVWPQWEKWNISKAIVFPPFNSWLNFRFLGQFGIKILIVRQINTTFFIWILKNQLEPAIIWKLVACKRITSKILELDESIPQPAIRYGDIGQRIPVLTAVNWSQHLCAILSAMCAISGCSWASKLARKCEIKHWFPCGADGRSAVGVRSRDYQFFSDG